MEGSSWKPYAMATFFLIFLRSGVRVLGNAQVPALFVFGDSLVDNGNNNGLASAAKSNYYPYGVDFYQGPTGRFSNGRTIVDVLCKRPSSPRLVISASSGSAGLIDYSFLRR